jgi:hypothetical protein
MIETILIFTFIAILFVAVAALDHYLPPTQQFRKSRTELQHEQVTRALDALMVVGPPSCFTQLENIRKRNG